MAAGRIEDQHALETVIGKTPPAIALKVIDHLDDGALRWLALSPLLCAGFGDERAISLTLAGGPRGFLTATRDTLTIAREALDDPALPRPGQAFGSLLPAPGVGETLRINGTVESVDSRAVQVRVTECYVHCAKALIRSDFWQAQPTASAPDEPAAFAAASPFMVLATMSQADGADVSPKGDPPGKLVRFDGNALLFAERPGNRRVDGFRNILARPLVAATLLIPGSSAVLCVEGTATLTTDEAARAAFEVRGKVPVLVTRVVPASLAIRSSAALAAAGLWPETPLERAPISPAQLLRDHMKINSRRGLGARVTSAIVSIPGLMEKGLEKDYQANLY